MAASIEPAVEINSEDTSHGHNIHYSYKQRTLVTTESWPLLLDIKANCSVRPTSWILGISYEQYPFTGQISCFATLTRTDRASTGVKATLLVSILDEKKRFVRLPRPICGPMKFIETDETINGTFEDSRDVLNPGGSLRISIIIRSCHLTENFVCQRYSRSNVKNMHCSKM